MDSTELPEGAIPAPDPGIPVDPSVDPDHGLPQNALAADAALNSSLPGAISADQPVVLHKRPIGAGYGEDVVLPADPDNPIEGGGFTRPSAEQPYKQGAGHHGAAPGDAGRAGGSPAPAPSGYPGSMRVTRVGGDPPTASGNYGFAAGGFFAAALEGFPNSSIAYFETADPPILEASGRVFLRVYHWDAPTQHYVRPAGLLALDQVRLLQVGNPAKKQEPYNYNNNGGFAYQRRL